MWIRKDDLSWELKNKESLDWVDINGTIWIEIPDEKGGPDLQHKDHLFLQNSSQEIGDPAIV